MIKKAPLYLLMTILSVVTLVTLIFGMHPAEINIAGGRESQSLGG